jgi:FixJ family two-component response regulator
MPANRIVHVVDDDPAFLRSMRALLDSAGFATCTYDSAPAVLDAASQLSGGCILLDVQMPGMNGLELQANLNELDIRLPVIVMTGQGDVATAVRAMKAGAVDFIEKPFDDDLLLTAIETALATAAGQASRERTIADAAALIAMSPREQQVLEGILAGRSNQNDRSWSWHQSPHGRGTPRPYAGAAPHPHHRRGDSASGDGGIKVRCSLSHAYS